MSSPSLVIRRLVVTGNLSCDLRFNRGINILQAVQTDNDPRSTNSCGKTSLVELIQYGLGRRYSSRDDFQFASIISQLKTLWMEVQLNDRVITIERSMQEFTARVRVREGTFSADMVNTPAEYVHVADLS